MEENALTTGPTRAMSRSPVTPSEAQTGIVSLVSKVQLCTVFPGPRACLPDGVGALCPAFHGKELREKPCALHPNCPGYTATSVLSQPVCENAPVPKEASGDQAEAHVSSVTDVQHVHE